MSSNLLPDYGEVLTADAQSYFLPHPCLTYGTTSLRSQVSGVSARSDVNCQVSVSNSAKWVIGEEFSDFIDKFAQSIKDSAFQSLPKMPKRMAFPNVSNVGQNAFRDCATLEDIVLPKCTTFGNYVFQGCVGLHDVEFPAFSGNLTAGMFQNCTNLETVKMPNASLTNTNVFSGCTNMFYLELSSVAQTIASANIPTGCVVKISNSMWAYGVLTSTNEFQYDDNHYISATPSSFGNNISDNYACGVAASAFGSSITEGFALALQNAIEVKPQAFDGCAKLSSVNIPHVMNIGESAFNNCSNLTGVTAPRVSVVGSYAFQNCEKLVSCSFPRLTDVNDGLCRGCVELSQFSAPLTQNVGADAFADCSALSSVNFPLATTVGTSAFMNCDSLTSVSLPKVSNLGSSAFCQCGQLQEVNLPNISNANLIGNDAFLTNSLKRIGLQGLRRSQVYDKLKDWGIPDGCLIECKDGNLKVDLSLLAKSFLTYDEQKYVVSVDSDGEFEIDLVDNYALGIKDTTDSVQGMFPPDSNIHSVTMAFALHVGSHAFLDCATLVSASFGSATTIGESAFQGCLGLTSVSLPNVTTLGANAFNGCSQLQGVDLPQVSEVGEDAFGGCTGLKMLRLGRITNLMDVWTTEDVPEGIQEVDVPLAVNIPSFANKQNLNTFGAASLTSISNGMFSGCVNLTTANFQSATTIGDSAFGNCVKLKTLNLPEVTSIGDNAFNGCETLVSVQFAKATRIGQAAFKDCSGLIAASFPEISFDDNIESAAFQGCRNLTTLGLEKLSVNTVWNKMEEWFGEGYLSNFPNLSIQCKDGVVFPRGRKYDMFQYDDRPYITGVLDQGTNTITNIVEGYAVGIQKGF